MWCSYSGVPTPNFEPDPLWFEALPNKWVTGAVGGVAVDSHDNVWVFHRPATIPDGEKAASFNPPRAECCIPAPSVIEFSSTGKFLQAWGAPGAGYVLRSDRRPINGENVSYGLVECQPGEIAVGGGFRATGDLEVWRSIGYDTFEDIDAIPTDGWYSGATGHGDGGRLTTYAVCRS